MRGDLAATARPRVEPGVLERYAVGLAAAVLALAAVKAFESALFPHTFTPFLVAVALSGWYGGFGAGLLTTLASAFLADYFVLSPVWDLGHPTPAEAFRLGFFVLGGVLLSALAESHHRTTRNETKRTRALRTALKERSETAALLDAVFAAAPVGLLFLDRQLRFVKVNQALADLDHTPVAAHLGRTLAEVQPEIASSLSPLFEEVFQLGASILNLDITGPASATGDRPHWLVSTYPVRTVSGEIRWAGSVVMDITVRKQSESAMGRLAAIIESSDDAIISKALDGTILTWNAAAQRIFGYTAAEIVGRSVFALVPADRVEEEHRILQRISRGEPATQVETIRVAKDGHPINVALSISPVLDGAGEIIGASTIARDITQRRQAEEALRESEERYRLIADNVRDLISMTDTQDRFTYVSPSYRTVLGYEPEALIGTSVLDLIHPEDRPLLGEWRESQGSLFRVRRADGQWIWVECVSYPVVWHGTSNVVPIARDVTPRKQMEDALRETVSRFRYVYDSGMISIAFFHLDGAILQGNDAFLELIGYTREDLVAGRIRWNDLTPPEWSARAALAMEELRRTRRTRPYELEVSRRDGARIPLLIGGAMLEGSSHEGVAFMLDITGRKRVEAEIQRMNEQLERTVAERTAAAEDRALELARSNAELEQFAYVASHDLQEPLRIVTNFTQLLQHRYRGRLDQDADEFIGFAVEGAHRMQSLITGLLAYSRVRVRGIEPEAVDLQHVLRQVLSNLGSPIAETEARITYDELPVVQADPGQMGQLFQNLVGNALKFRRLDARPEVHIGVEHQEEGWLFWVRDNGIGIAREYAEKVFVIFQRLHGRDEYPGTGLGLAICKSIVERHGGRIWVEPAGEVGSIFRFTLPTAEGRPADRRHAGRRRQDLGPGTRQPDQPGP